MDIPQKNAPQIALKSHCNGLFHTFFATCASYLIFKIEDSCKTKWNSKIKKRRSLLQQLVCKHITEQSPWSLAFSWIACFCSHIFFQSDSLALVASANPPGQPYPPNIRADRFILAFLYRAFLGHTLCMIIPLQNFVKGAYYKRQGNHTGIMANGTVED